MSLINDALKRTKQVQQQAPSSPAPGPELRPIESAPAASRGNTLLLVVALVVFCPLAGWFIFHGVSRPEPIKVAAATLPAQPAPTPPTAAPPPAVEPPTQPSPAVAVPAPEPAPAPVAASAPAAPDTLTTNAPSAPPEPPGPAPLKLQGIVFHPKRPSAMISGKTLFVGDSVGEFQVVAIGRESVILAGAGQTNTLSLR